MYSDTISRNLEFIAPLTRSLESADDRNRHAIRSKAPGQELRSTPKAMMGLSFAMALAGGASEERRERNQLRDILDEIESEFRFRSHSASGSRQHCASITSSDQRSVLKANDSLDAHFYGSNQVGGGYHPEF